MSYDFNVDEVFEMAEQIERNGAEFYRKMAESIAGNITSRQTWIYREGGMKEAGLTEYIQQEDSWREENGCL